MKLRNPFSNETRQLFWEARYVCWICGGNGQNSGGTELNHILGRSSASPLNASVLCHECHSRIKHTDEEHRQLFGITLPYLQARGYEWDEKDKAFYEKEIKPLL